jgi:poly(3-hydroxybutyrate) depolymerase
MASPGPTRSAADWGEQVRKASPAYKGQPPYISIWHGDADTVVDPGNADLLAIQWGAVHGLPQAPSTDVVERNARHRTWIKGGKTVMERWTLPDMAHGYPIDESSGRLGPYIVDRGLSGTRNIARFFGLL